MRTAAVSGERNGERLKQEERENEREREREREREKAPSQGRLQASPTCPRSWKKLLPLVYAT